jgi:hypothetical protein
MEKSHADLVEFIDRLPSRPQNGEANVSVLIDVWVEDLVEALDLGRLEGVFFGGLEGKVDLRVPVEGSVLVGNNLDVEVSDRTFIGEGDHHILDAVFIVLLNVDLHSLLDSLEVGAALVFNLFLGLHSFFFESLDHK